MDHAAVVAGLVARNPIFGFQYDEATDPGLKQRARGGKAHDSSPDHRDIEFLRHDPPLVRFPNLPTWLEYPPGKRLLSAMESTIAVQGLLTRIFRISDILTKELDMKISESSRIGKRGTLVIPAKLRRRFGIEEGSEVIAEETPEGILIRPAVTVPLELYTEERKAEFLLSNAVSAEDYERAAQAVRKMGLDPANISHQRPAGV